MRDRTHAIEYELTDETGNEFQMKPPEAAGVPSFDLETATFEVSEAEGRRMLRRINERLVSFEEEHRQTPECLILGIEDYLTVDAYLQSGAGGSPTSAQSHFSVPVHIVPGRMIHVPRPEGIAITEYLSESEDE